MVIVGIAATDPVAVLSGPSEGCYRFWIRESLPENSTLRPATHHVVARISQKRADLIRQGWPCEVHGTPRARAWASDDNKPRAQVLVHAWDVLPLDPFRSGNDTELEDCGEAN